MATLYFNAAVDNLWETPGNWWLNAQHTVPAANIPTSSDSVVLSAPCTTTDPNDVVTVVNCDITPPDDAAMQFNISITVTGVMTVNRTAYLDADAGTSQTDITGTVIFNNNSRADRANIVGHATFNDNAVLAGYVTGVAVFNDNAMTEFAVIVGDATFNDNSANGDGASVMMNAIFNDNALNLGVVQGDATFNDNAVNNFYTYSGIYSDVIFSDNSYNKSGLYGDFLFAYKKGINGSSILGLI